LALDDLRARVELVPWYHTIELPGGVVTPGGHDHRDLVAHLGLPDDLTGQRVLDVATFDGFWAFELERRGADVVAIDLPTVACLDWPIGAREVVLAEELDLPLGTAFAIAHEALGSKVERFEISVYDLDPDVIGRFDLVFLGDLLMHLERPLEALRRVRSLTDHLILVDRFDPSISGQGCLIRYGGGWRHLDWWAPSAEALAQWVVDAGFDDTDLRLSYEISGWRRDRPGWSRALIHASAGSGVQSLDSRRTASV
jgi:tRNA (mo5U34)-methyltransferase